MKVTDVKTFLVHPGVQKNWLFVKVETDEGIHGWGEAYNGRGRERSIEAFILAMRGYLVGRSPFAIKHFSQVMYEDFAGKRGSMDYYCAFSAIELALWDIVGKALNTPVYNLIGGPCRDRIRIYANGWGSGNNSPQELAERAAELVNRGFTAMKWDPFPGPWRTFISREDELRAVENVRAVREAVGPKVDLLIEVHRRLAPMHAIRVGRMIEELNPFWYEEPVSSENLDALAEVRRNISIPVVTGEALYTKMGFRQVFEKAAADIINPDICNCGGILELKEIAAMAEPYYVVVAPHNANSVAVALAATIQLATCIPNFLITEYFVNFESPCAEVSQQPFKVENGYIRVPTAPGLGFELDEEALGKRQFKDFERHIRQYYDEGP